LGAAVFPYLSFFLKQKVDLSRGTAYCRHLAPQINGAVAPDPQDMDVALICGCAIPKLIPGNLVQRTQFPLALLFAKESIRFLARARKTHFAQCNSEIETSCCSRPIIYLSSTLLNSSMLKAKVDKETRETRTQHNIIIYSTVWYRTIPAKARDATTPKHNHINEHQFNTLGATATTAALCTVMFYLFILTRL
jgi:hypothetical protein